MMEAICSVIYAGQRVATDLTEVATLRKMLVDKYQSVSTRIWLRELLVTGCCCHCPWRQGSKHERQRPPTGVGTHTPFKVLYSLLAPAGLQS